jgi:hypothetical protein
VFVVLLGPTKAALGNPSAMPAILDIIVQIHMTCNFHAPKAPSKEVITARFVKNVHRGIIKMLLE